MGRLNIHISTQHLKLEALMIDSMEQDRIYRHTRCILEVKVTISSQGQYQTLPNSYPGTFKLSVNRHLEYLVHFSSLLTPNFSNI